MPPKSRKGGLNNEQVLNVVSIVKEYWKDYPITSDSITNPTRDFVITFYKDCVQNLDEKLAFATRSPLIPDPPNLGDEELLYLKLSRIQTLAQTHFKLSDLYIFDPIRVMNFIHVIMHFLMFTDTIMDKTVNICNNIFDTKEKTNQGEEELKTLKDEKHEKQVQSTVLKSEKKKLEQQLADLSPEYEATIACIEESEIKCKDKVNEVEKIKLELENYQEEVQKFEKTLSHLKSQIVTEKEYAILKNNLESVIHEDKNLEEIDLHNGLFEQNQHMEYLEMCLSDLHHLKLSDDIYELSDYRKQFKDENKSLQYERSLQKSSEKELNAFKLQLQNEKKEVEAKEKDLQEQLRVLTENGLSSENKLKKKYQQICENNQIKIIELQKSIEILDANVGIIKKDYKEKYERICETYNRTLREFKIFLSEIDEATDRA